MSSEYGDALDVMRHREEVEGSQRGEPVPLLGEERHVPGQGRGIAGDVRTARGEGPATAVTTSRRAPVRGGSRTTTSQGPRPLPRPFRARSTRSWVTATWGRSAR